MAMKFEMACNWDPALLDGLAGSPADELFGGMPNSPIAGGRASFVAAEATPEFVQQYVAEARRRGLRFNFLLNATCLDNLEYQREGNRRIVEHIAWVESIGVDAVTVSIPFLLRIIKKQFPRLEVKISSHARVNNPRTAQFWGEWGADSIILKEDTARDFRTLEAIRKAFQGELILIANPGCLFECHQALNHTNTMSHGSQSGHVSEGFMIDSCYFSCTRKKMADPRELIKIRWIRPEDVGYYEDVGIDRLKIIDRYKTTEMLLSYLKAYSERRYEGNLIDLLNLPRRGAFLPVNLKYLMREEFVNTDKLMDFADCCDMTVSELIQIDSRKIPADFLDFFKEMDCVRTSCDECGYCDRIAEKAVRVKGEELKAQVAKYDAFLEDLAGGSVFQKEQEYRADQELVWEEEAKRLHEDLLEAVPPLLKKIAQKKTAAGAEKSARETRSNSVRKEDVLKGWLTETPSVFLPKVKERLQELGMEIESGISLREK
jgi:collagenase-like PrtC family protease